MVVNSEWEKIVFKCYGLDLKVDASYQQQTGRHSTQCAAIIESVET